LGLLWRDGGQTLRDEGCPAPDEAVGAGDRFQGRSGCRFLKRREALFESISAKEGAALKLLLIEDNENDAVLVREMLKRSTWLPIRVVWARSLSEGLAQLSESEFDAVLVDLGLPDCQGANAFMRVHDHAPELPVIVLTGLDDDSVALAAVHAGAQDYLMKGELREELLTRSVRYAIERHKVVKKLRWYADALAEKEQHLSQIIESLSLGILVTDADGTIRFANSAAAETLGRDKTELVGSSVEFSWESGKTQNAAIPREGREPVACEVETQQIRWEGQDAFLLTLRGA
jgi:PAS domain S-box-containing protein